MAIFGPRRKEKDAEKPQTPTDTAPPPAADSAPVTHSVVAWRRRKGHSTWKPMGFSDFVRTLYTSAIGWEHLKPDPRIREEANRIAAHEKACDEVREHASQTGPLHFWSGTTEYMAGVNIDANEEDGNG